MRPRLTAGLLALTLVAGLSFAGAAPASAADFDPALGGSQSAARTFKINVLGKILGNAAPTSWQREQLANQNKYNQAWETLEQMYGTKSGGAYTGPPDSYQDYVIRKKEIETTGKLTVTGPNGTTTTTGKGTTFKAPITKPNKLISGVANGGAVVSSGAFGVWAGNAGADLGLGLFGMTKEGLVCGQANEGVKVWASIVNGVDCETFGFDETYVPNSDATGAGVTLNACSPVTGRCYTFDGLNLLRADTTIICGSMTDLKPGDGKTQYIEYWMTDSKGEKRRITGGSFGATPQSTMNQYCGGKGNMFETFDPRDGTFTGVRMTTDGPIQELQETTEDPLRTIECSVTGTDGKTYTASSEPFRESEEQFAAPECPTLPEGVVPQDIALSSVNGDTGSKTDLLAPEINQEWLDWWRENPECRNGECAQELYKKVDGTLLDCFENTEKCADWFEDPKKAENYQCRYNEKDVDIANCYIYSGMFKPGRVASGSPYSDPLTGAWSGGQNSPSRGEQAYATPLADPDTMRSCVKETITLNPIDWVMVPTQCALQWAFVPRPAVIKAETAAVAESWSKTTPAKFATFIGGVKITPDVNGCGGIPLDLPFLPKGMKPLSFGEACPGTLLAGIASTIRLVLTALVSWGGVVMISRHIAGVVNYRGIE